MNNEQVTMRFATIDDYEELTKVFHKTFQYDNSYDSIKDNLLNIPNSCLIGLVDNKIVAHLFAIQFIPTDNINDWFSSSNYVKDSENLFIWGAGILEDYRIKYNFSSCGTQKIIESNPNTKTIYTTVLHSDKKMAKAHMNVGYKVINVINNCNNKKGIQDHLYVLKLDYQTHKALYGFARMNKMYGKINNSIEPKFEG